MISHPSEGLGRSASVLTRFKRNLVWTMEVGQLRKEDKLMYTKLDSVDRDDVIMKRIEKRVWDSSYDLVKSHLMFAVREEVEVLKEQIKELMERTGQLEYENGILRAAASPETLAMLAQPRQQPPSSSS